MIDENEWGRIARYLAGECSPDEAKALQQWIESDAERRLAAAFMRDVDERMSASRPAWDTAGSWTRLLARKSARLRRRPLLSMVPSDSRLHRGPFGSAGTARRFVLRAAAGLLVACSAIGLAMWARPLLRSATSANQAALRTIATKNAQRASLTLADGSTIVLAPASRLRYASDFGTNTRDVYLDGEAYFDVVHDGDHAFAVHTATAITKDLGTAFSVHAYASDTTVRVVVAEGSVELRAKHLPSGRRGAVLTAGQVGRLARDGTALVQPSADVSRYLAWTKGRLVFDDTPLGDAVLQLERWYDVELRLADPSLARLSLTGSYKDEPLAEVIQNIALALNLRVEHKGGTIILAAKRTAP